jgi:hypothetical protein
MWWAVAVAAASTGVGTLEGVVTSSVDGRGLPNVDVVLRLDGEHAQHASPELAEVPLRHVRTDRAGAFTFDGLPPGLYSLDVIGLLPTGAGPAAQGVWTHVAPILVAPGLTATRQVVLRPAPAVELRPGAPTAPRPVPDDA